MCFTITLLLVVVVALELLAGFEVHLASISFAGNRSKLFLDRTKSVI